jgi:acyl-CoA thioester hydrolase
VSFDVAFRTSFVVTEKDIDDLEHTSNIAYVRWIQEIASAHSEAVGLDLDTYRRVGGVFVVVRHEIDYLRPTVRGDLLIARTWLPSVMAAKCIRATEIVRGPEGTLVTRAQTTWGWIDLASGRPRRIPAEVRAAFFNMELADAG